MSLAEVPVEDSERLARAILTDRHIRKNAGTGEVSAKAEAFLPYKHVELSVIRHRGLSDGELWEIAREVAAKRGKPLVARGDFSARDARSQNLDVVPAEGPDAPRNHADVNGWPPEKQAQLLRAVEIAAVASTTLPP